MDKMDRMHNMHGRRECKYDILVIKCGGKATFSRPRFVWKYTVKMYPGEWIGVLVQT
jgi:hypothetical protein